MDEDHNCPGVAECVICARIALNRNAHLVDILPSNKMPECFEASRPLTVALAQMYVELRGVARN